MAKEVVNGIEYNIGEDLHGDLYGSTEEPVDSTADPRAGVDLFAGYSKKYKVPNVASPKRIESNPLQNREEERMVQAQREEAMNPFNVFSRFASGVGEAVSEGASQIGQAAGQIGAGAQQIMGGDLVGGAQQIGQGALGVPQGAAQLLTAPAQPLIDFGVESAIGTGEGALRGLQKAGQGVADVAGATGAVLSAPFTGQDAREEGTQAYRGMSNILQGALDTIFSPVGGAIQASDPMIQQGMADMGEIYNEIVDGVVTGLGGDPEDEETQLLVQNLQNAATVLAGTNAAARAWGVKGPGDVASAAGRRVAAEMGIKPELSSPLTSLPREAVTKLRKGFDNTKKTFVEGIKKRGTLNEAVKKFTKLDFDDFSTLGNEKVARAFMDAADNPNAYTEALKSQVDDVLDDLISSRGTTGSVIGELKRQRAPLKFDLSGNWATNLAKKKFNLATKNGVLVPKAGVGKSKVLSDTQISKLNEYVKRYNNLNVDDVAQYKNITDDLTRNIGAFEAGGRDLTLKQFGASLYDKIKTQAHKVSPVLKKADADYANVMKDLTALQKDGILKRVKTPAGTSYELSKTFLEPNNINKLLRSNRFENTIKILGDSVDDLLPKVQAAKVARAIGTGGPSTGIQNASQFLGGATGAALGSTFGPLGAGAGGILGLAAPFFVTPKEIAKMMARQALKQQAATGTISSATREAVRRAPRSGVQTGSREALQEGGQQAFDAAAGLDMLNIPTQ